MGGWTFFFIFLFLILGKPSGMEIFVLLLLWAFGIYFQYGYISKGVSFLEERCEREKRESDDEAPLNEADTNRAIVQEQLNLKGFDYYADGLKAGVDKIWGSKGSIGLGFGKDDMKIEKFKYKEEKPLKPMASNPPNSIE